MHNPIYVKLYINWGGKIISSQEAMLPLNELQYFIAY